MTVMAMLVATSFLIVLGTHVWAWRAGTLNETSQERYDREYERIVARLRRGEAQ